MARVNQRLILGLLVGAMGGYVAVATAEEQAPRMAPVIDRSAGSVSLENRVTALERKLDNQALLDMLSRVEGLQNETQALRSQVEELTHKLETQEQRQRDLYVDMDSRLRGLETGGASSAATSSPPVASTPRTPPAVIGPGAASVAQPATTVSAAATSSPADPAKERDAYQQAFNELKDGRYDQAIGLFRNFLASYPDGEYASNAQYWLGEANYVTRRFPEAEQEFRKVLERYPNSSKVGDAGLKLGYTYYELGNWQAASKSLSDVVAKFPGSTAARLADARLQKIRQEGH